MSHENAEPPTIAASGGTAIAMSDWKKLSDSEFRRLRGFVADLRELLLQCRKENDRHGIGVLSELGCP